jgi:hypothetical protein
MSTTSTERPLYIPIILGTARQGRRSEYAARFVLEQTQKRAGVETEIIDVREIPMRLDDAGEQIKDPGYAATITRCDGLILVVPEYNHGYPGLLKACPRHVPGGIHPQGGRYVWRFGGTIRWLASDRESARSDARARAGDDLQ